MAYFMCFVEKTVLDVGTGSGILAIWSAQAGAKKVYAVEATKMAEHARVLIKANNLEDVVEVIESNMEDVSLPEKGIHCSIKVLTYELLYNIVFILKNM